MREDFDPTKSTPEQRQEEIALDEENRDRLRKLMQHHIQRQRERFEMLSRTLGLISEPKNETIADNE